MYPAWFLEGEPAAAPSSPPKEASSAMWPTKAVASSAAGWWWWGLCRRPLPTSIALPSLSAPWTGVAGRAILSSRLKPRGPRRD